MHIYTKNVLIYLASSNYDKLIQPETPLKSGLINALTTAAK